MNHFVRLSVCLNVGNSQFFRQRVHFTNILREAAKKGIIVRYQVQAFRLSSGPGGGGIFPRQD